MGAVEVKSREKLIEEQYLEKIKPLEKHIKGEITKQDLKNSKLGSNTIDKEDIDSGESKSNLTDNPT
ncbi:MAG: hypothetical protein EU550_00830 [Promethearchaeota archaeon]|nr:MAG: hypothetical protein EU550_00830 [Candidatus Lokiarchaeota archaeon]